MRRPAPRLLASAPHPRLRATVGPVSLAFSQPAPAINVLPSESTPSWPCCRPCRPYRPRPKQGQPTSVLAASASLRSQVPPLTRRYTHTTSHQQQPPPAADAVYPPLDDDGRLDPSALPKLPFRFDTGIALFAKRTPRPFPPPFLSPPSGSFSDPLSTHDRSRDRRRRAYVGGRLIQGFTNGDDAVFASDYFICANDGVGAWCTRPRGHAGLWARLILHFWATAIFEDAARQGNSYQPDPVAYLQRAYEQTIEATSAPNDWQGTTTASGAQLHYRRLESGESAAAAGDGVGGDAIGNGENAKRAAVEPLLYVTNLGDSQVMVIRPPTREMVYKSTEQWHWFDCPRQLGTNSPDTPATCAVVDQVPIREGDVVLAMSDGVIDNLWEHEIVEKVCESMEKWRAGQGRGRSAVLDGASSDDGGMGYVAEELMEAAKTIAVDPFAESPFMEHAIEEGLASGGGKLDDISVVAALCRRNGV